MCRLLLYVVVLLKLLATAGALFEFMHMYPGYSTPVAEPVAAADATDRQRPSNAEIKSNDVEEIPILPKEPMVIEVDVKSLTTNTVRVEYRGCHKFCVGLISGYPYNDDTKVWNPYNQSTNQVYYFRYVAVDMQACDWPMWASPPALRIPELFFDSSTSDSITSDSSTSDDNYTEGDEYAKQGVDSYHGYVLSYPGWIQGGGFNFLIYNPQIKPSNRWTVRWTGYMNTCRPPTNGTIPIDNHYELDAFDPGQYVTF